MKVVVWAAVLALALAATARAASDLPVANGVVTSGVGWRLDPFGSGRQAFHRGIDIAVPVGTPVRAVRDGRVVFAGERSGYGATVVVAHANGERTLYGHNSLVRVTPGQSVEAGTVVAFSGNSGRSTGPHVHFEYLPGDGPAPQQAANDEPAISQADAGSAQRHRLELKLDDSVNAVLRTIGAAGLGG